MAVERKKASMMGLGAAWEATRAHPQKRRDSRQGGVTLSLVGEYLRKICKNPQTCAFDDDFPLIMRPLRANGALGSANEAALLCGAFHMAV